LIEISILILPELIPDPSATTALMTLTEARLLTSNRLFIEILKSGHKIFFLVIKVKDSNKRCNLHFLKVTRQQKRVPTNTAVAMTIVSIGTLGTHSIYFVALISNHYMK